MGVKSVLYIVNERNKMLRNPEFGRGTEPTDDLEMAEGAEVEEIITNVQQEILASADLTPANSNTLNEIFDLARATYDKDVKAWDQLFENLTSEVSNASDDDDTEDILRGYKRKAGALV